MQGGGKEITTDNEDLEKAFVYRAVFFVRKGTF